MAIDFPNSPTNGQTYTVGSFTWQYDGEKWIAANGITLDGLTDVTAPTPSSGDFLKWNGSAWVNDPINLGTDTTGNYMSGVSAGTGISVTHTPSEGSTGTVAVNTATVPLLASANTFSTNQIIEGSSTSDLLRITQTGTGNALVVEDSANPDSTPFVITSAGDVIHGHTALESEWYMSSGNSHRFFIVDNDNAGTVGGNVWLGRYNGAAGLSISRSNGTNIGDRGVIVSGDIIGGIAWSADDAVTAGHIRTAQIVVTAEGTIGTNIVPSRMTFSTGNTTGLDTERMRIDSSGQIGIGGTPSAGRNLTIGKAITGATTSYSVLVNGTVQSDVTTSAHGYTTSFGTVASAFTLTNLIHFRANQATIGATSSVTNQFGFYVDAGLSGATTNNHGFSGNLAAATGSYNLYMGGTAANYLAGRLGVGVGLTSGAMAQITNTTAADKAFVVKGAASQSGTLFEAQNSAASALFVIDSSGQVGISTTPSAGRSLTVSKAITGATTSFGIVMNGTVQSDVTTAVQGIRSAMATAAASFTLGLAYSFYAGQGTVGAGSSITTAIGYIADSSLTAATNNYGFYGDIASGTGRWNLYMNGTAANYLAGRLGVGATNTTGAMVAITNTTAADDALIIKGATSQAGYLTEWQDSSGTTVAYVNADGTSSFGGNPLTSSTAAAVFIMDIGA